MAYQRECCMVLLLLLTINYTHANVFFQPSTQDVRATQDERLDALEKHVGELQETLSHLIYLLKHDRSTDEGHHLERRQIEDPEEDSYDYDELLSEMPLNAFAGLRGPPGRDGRDGHDGRDGSPGSTGPPGAMGTPGVPGAAGPVGAPGRDGNCGALQAGDAGQSGPSGEKGAPGERGIPGVAAYSGNSTGTVYTRWGRKTCGNYSQLLYEGFAAGSRFDHMGGGTDYLCMPKIPEYNSFSNLPANQWLGSWIGGTEYQSHYYGIFSRDTHDENVPCARCYTNSRSALMMIPARRSCPEGWLMEYEGYLMTGARYDHNHMTAFECVDSNPEYVTGFGSDTNGALFYFVRPFCDGMATIGHCPPYVTEREITCVVCSR